MFACICRAVTTDQVSAAIDSGASTVSAVARATRACTSCGMCRERIEGMLGQSKDRPLEMPPLEMPPMGMSESQAA